MNNKPEVFMKKFSSKAEAVQFLETLPFRSLIDVAADALIIAQGKPTQQKITISEQQFRDFFRIRGINEDGVKENRGRPKKNA